MLLAGLCTNLLVSMHQQVVFGHAYATAWSQSMRSRASQKPTRGSVEGRRICSPRILCSAFRSLAQEIYSTYINLHHHQCRRTEGFYSHRGMCGLQWKLYLRQKARDHRSSRTDAFLLRQLSCWREITCFRGIHLRLRLFFSLLRSQISTRDVSTAIPSRGEHNQPETKASGWVLSITSQHNFKPGQ